ncbi:MAG TPA: DUF2092 domain-containing protein [Streptosporangiaceae bacterium]
MMGQVRHFSRRLRLRWAVPAAVVAVAGAVLAGTVLASAAPPSLPHRTPAQLLAGLHKATAPAALSGVVSESANLGIPALPDLPGISSSALSATSLLTGSHTIEVWYAGPRHVRIAVPVSFGETDLRVNGNQVWLWQSQGSKATRYVVPASPGPGRDVIRAPGYSSPAPGPTPNSTPGSTPGQAPGSDPLESLTPPQAAQRVLAMVGKTTRVTVPGTVEVAGRPAYELAIAPRSSQSLIGKILIAIDAATRLPLQVQVFARGASSPAFQIGFTSLSFARPAMSNFTFTPPPGAQVKTVRPSAPASVPSGAGPSGGQPGSRQGWGTHPGSGPAGAQVFGTGWLTVAAVAAGQVQHLPGQSQGTALARLLLKVTTPVHGTWGSGRLLRTSLLSVLITSKGQILVGAVTPAVLYADAAKVK